MLAPRLIRNCILRKPQVVGGCVQLVRHQSKKPDFPDFSKINDPKLREIIEGTNFGTEAILKKEREEAAKRKKIEEERKKLEQEREVQRKRDEKDEEERKKLEEEEIKKHRDEKIAKANEKLELKITETESGKIKGVDKDTHETTVETEDDEYKLRMENKIIATSKADVDDSEIPNLAKEINETIQNEIGGLPSQKAKQQSEMAKKLTKYLDSAHDTILTATRALNDVTGYSAIEKLKKSIEEQEVDLKQAKENVKKCKVAYGEAIQRRSHSQREVNELLTRKHNWSLHDLERFTELYRNDHENERMEEEAEKKLDESESKVDAVQLKLTQLILTRYHEEQIWSDKIRRSSTWGTWVLMGLNVLLFVVATFIVEPWKRNKLVYAFEDKVKQVLVGISQENQAVLEPIIEKLEPTDGQVPIPEEPAPAPKPFNFRFIHNTWNGIKEIFWDNYNALASRDIQKLEFDKYEFEIFTVSLAVVAFTIGSLVTTLFK
ncbi:Sensitive to high expression protein 9, mitochondrial [Candida viswanathii]|uniref:Sensitive to high expression protein 9, mitochondrial n=1 Tax=Candida viswanathii TaxID=5486 RepID=A0A367XMG1_9ASCO|nr:Sensitive to high expression protein 9, mitochondrial [Candida viswanathii]